MNRRRLVALRLLGLGWYVAACIVIGVVGGLGLDRLSGLTPLFTLLGVLLGTVAAFYGLYKMVRPLLNSPAPTEKPHANGDLP
jgi:F0F1-type ATP synthase assembly protein I